MGPSRTHSRDSKASKPPSATAPATYQSVRIGASAGIRHAVSTVPGGLLSPEGLAIIDALAEPSKPTKKPNLGLKMNAPALPLVFKAPVQVSNTEETTEDEDEEVGKIENEEKDIP